MTELRQRPPSQAPQSSQPSQPSQPSEPSQPSKPSSKPISISALAKREDTSISVLDICRVLVFLVLASCTLSYFITKESAVWNMKRPAFTRFEAWRSWVSGPQQHTDASLRAYDGSDPTLPILLALNGTIYDVSAGRRHYGPGGSYHFFAGADASRAFVTSCFQTDITPDMRGVETMFLPLDDPEIDALYTKRELKILRQKEARSAKEEVRKALKHWVDFFEGSRKYFKVGTVKREKGWENRGEPPELCESAQKQRKPRPRPEGK
ncbi:hypothetical protein B7494_g1323 [Chlorociboria aeruginascens]|nr:hypothetical protein B7494_g1323 [Chlorociboria aeruginascens]